MRPRFSVLIPTLNEAGRIAQTVTHTRAVLGDDVEIIVSDGGSRDDTVARAQAAGARIVTGAHGRGPQLDVALRAATGDICVLLHADTLLPAQARVRMEEALIRARAGAFLLYFEEPQMRWLAWFINLRSRLFRSATGDQAMFAPRELLLELGGVPHVELFEDVRLWKTLKRAGRVRLVSPPVTTSARLWLRAGTLRVILLHWRLRLLHALGVPPQELAKRYPTARS